MRFETLRGVASFDRTVWNLMAETASPMMEWDYYFCLEESASVSPQRGYQPCHLVLLDGDEPVAVAPLFARDRAWVEFGDGGLLELLAEMTGYPFHRGVVGTIPFTPVPSYQFLHRPDVDAFQVHQALLNQIDALCAESHYVTSRIYFVAPTAHHLHSLLHAQGYISLKSDYYLWKNHDYADFEDFLKTFKSSRRTKIKRELRTIRDAGIETTMAPGTSAPASWYADIYRFYLATWNKHMGSELRPFLNEAFFRLLGEEFRHRIRFSVASRSEANIAMAIFYEKAGNLYGRYWGLSEPVPFLHFATCYYNPIRYAIETRMRSMDPGFGGEHKLHRGYEISPAYHYIKFHGATERRVAYSILNQIQTHAAKGKPDW
jgi:hypothetical protein